jgi:hypothetical protein
MPHGDTDPRPLCDPASTEPTSSQFNCLACVEVLDGIRWWLHDLAEAAKTVHVRKAVPQADRRATNLRGRNARYGSGRRPVGPQAGDPRSQTVCGAPADTRDLSYGEARTRGGFEHVTCPGCRTGVITAAFDDAIAAFRVVDAAPNEPASRKLVDTWVRKSELVARMIGVNPTAVEVATITATTESTAAALRELGVSPTKGSA